MSVRGSGLLVPAGACAGPGSTKVKSSSCSSKPGSCLPALQHLSAQAAPHCLL